MIGKTVHVRSVNLVKWRTDITRSELSITVANSTQKLLSTQNVCVEIWGDYSDIITKSLKLLMT